jgi:Zn-dependent M28 family amino/carboxypeptidase
MKTMPASWAEWKAWLVRVVIFLVCVAVLVQYMSSMPDRSYKGLLKPLTERETQLRDSLRGHVIRLGGEIGERHIWLPDRLEAAAAFIEGELVSCGYSVTQQIYRANGVAVRNIEVELPGTGHADQIIVIGAHYDSVPGSPGANDNGSGVAALVELARALKGEDLGRTVRFVAFVNEEPPFFMTKQMGSRVYSARSAERGEKIVAMIALETIGCYSDEPGSQAYPPLFNLLYPDKGDFIGFIGNLGSRSLVRRMLGLFREEASFPSEGCAAPGWVTGIGWSDHWSFWEEGFPAIMITDTAPFRYRYYHSTEDTPDKIDYDRMARVVAGLIAPIRGLAKNGP